MAGFRAGVRWQRQNIGAHPRPIPRRYNPFQATAKGCLIILPAAA
jgi:hypothetical protein